MIENLRRNLATSLAAFALVLAGCGAPDADGEPPATLKDAFAGKFLVGGALDSDILRNPEHRARGIAEKHFNTLTSANALKWGPMNPQPGVYDFELADRFVEYAASNGFDVVGHVLFWHSQTPDWVFEDDQGQPLSREALLDRMRERARLLAERYGDRVKTWDVVNESIEGDGSLRRSKFRQIIGDDWNEQAFRIAAEALPADAKLLYNDYGMTEPGRRDAVVAMVKDFQARGIRIDGIGMQGHWSMHRPTLEEIEDAIEAYASTGLPIHFTELDVDLLGRDGLTGADVDIRLKQANAENNPFPDGQVPEAEEARFAERYAEIFKLLLKHSEKIERVTFWGVTDADSWLNNWPVYGRTNYALLFGRDNVEKPALRSVIEAANEN